MENTTNNDKIGKRIAYVVIAVSILLMLCFNVSVSEKQESNPTAQAIDTVQTKEMVYEPSKALPITAYTPITSNIGQHTTATNKTTNNTQESTSYKTEKTDTKSVAEGMVIFSLLANRSITTSALVELLRDMRTITDLQYAVAVHNNPAMAYLTRQEMIGLLENLVKRYHEKDIAQQAKQTTSNKQANTKQSAKRGNK